MYRKTLALTALDVVALVSVNPIRELIGRLNAANWIFVAAFIIMILSVILYLWNDYHSVSMRKAERKKFVSFFLPTGRWTFDCVDCMADGIRYGHQYLVRMQ